MSVTGFTANHEDLSTNRGYQFKFYCDKCGNGYMSRFQPSAGSGAGTLLKAAGEIFGGILAASGSGSQQQRTGASREHAGAGQRAVEEAKGYFKQCRTCGSWVCLDGCWNAEAERCEGCGEEKR